MPPQNALPLAPSVAPAHKHPKLGGQNPAPAAPVLPAIPRLSESFLKVGIAHGWGILLTRKAGIYPGVIRTYATERGQVYEVHTPGEEGATLLAVADVLHVDWCGQEAAQACAAALRKVVQEVVASAVVSAPAPGPTTAPAPGPTTAPAPGPTTAPAPGPTTAPEAGQ